MLRKSSVAASLALAVLLSGCDIGVRADAAKTVERFMAAVHAGDRAAFETVIDREALRADLRDQLTDMAREKGVVVDGGPSEFALDRMISPNAFRLVEAGAGKALPQAPTLAEVAPMIQVRDRTHVCVGDQGQERCELAFAKRDGVWRLVGMRATHHIIEIPPAPTKR